MRVPLPRRQCSHRKIWAFVVREKPVSFAYWAPCPKRRELCGDCMRRRAFSSVMRVTGKLSSLNLEGRWVLPVVRTPSAHSWNPLLLIRSYEQWRSKAQKCVFTWKSLIIPWICGHCKRKLCLERWAQFWRVFFCSIQACNTDRAN